MADNEREMLEGASVQMWCGVAQVALETGDAEGAASAAEQLRTLAMDISISSDERASINSCADAVGAQLMQGGLEKLDQIVQQFEPDTTALKKAIEVAENGGASLSIPKAAAKANKALSSLQKVKQALENWRQTKRDDTLDDLNNEKDSLLSALEDLSSVLHTNR